MRGAPDRFEHVLIVLLVLVTLAMAGLTVIGWFGLTT